MAVAKNWSAIGVLAFCAGGAAGIGGCGGGSGNGDGGTPDLAHPPLGMAIDAPKNTWTWVDFPDTTCDDGSPTGLAINPSDSKNVIIMLEGGGACWDYGTCFTINASTHGPFGKTQFDAAVGSLAGGVISRTGTNPFKDWNLVYVPYCTGDLYIGDNVATYMSGGNTKMVNHKGHANIIAYLKRLGATWPATDKAVFSGRSAGGFGVALNYYFFRQYFPTGEGYMLDDSGPLLQGNDVPSTFLDAWWRSWGVAPIIDPFCPTCKADVSTLGTTLAKDFAKDRLALLSSQQDMVISGRILLSPSGFQTALGTAEAVMDTTANFKYFVIPGNSHTMILDPTNAKYTSAGLQLNTWLNTFVSDDPNWKSTKPQ